MRQGRKGEREGVWWKKGFEIVLLGGVKN